MGTLLAGHTAIDKPHSPHHGLGTGRLRLRLEAALAAADVILDGPRRWDPQVLSPRLYWRPLIGGSIGIGDAYVDGDWECEALDELAFRVLRAHLPHLIPARSLGHRLLAALSNRQTPRLAQESVLAHYDIGEDLHEAMLGPSMTYSCAYWRNATTLEQAQEAKLELVCRKLMLQKGMRLLDLGCGWGALARHAAERFEVEVVGVTLSPTQAAYATELCRGLPVEIRLQDYRALSGSFDRIASIGMFEHVGAANHRTFFEVVREHLAPGGMCLLHTIGSLMSARSIDPWMGKYIFPNAALPSARQIMSACEGLFVLEDWHNFGAFYDRTLMSWHANFEAAWPELRSRYGERFRRMWRYYLLTCAGGFRARHTQLWQLLLSRDGILGGYERPSMAKEALTPRPALAAPRAGRLPGA